MSAETRLAEFEAHRSRAVLAMPVDRAMILDQVMLDDFPLTLSALRVVLALVEPMHPDDLASDVDQAVERLSARIRAAIAGALA